MRNKGESAEPPYYHPEMKEFLLMYDDVRTAESPNAELMEFLQSTYEAAADLGQWDREALERSTKEGSAWQKNVLISTPIKVHQPPTFMSARSASKLGDTWVHLRLCLECGHVGCCDSSKNKHATKHFHRGEASADPLHRAGRDLDLVLCG